jgi:hypothetical protein
MILAHFPRRQREFLKVSVYSASPTACGNIVLLAAGWVGRDAILMAGINAIIYTLSTLPTSVFVPP